MLYINKITNEGQQSLILTGIPQLQVNMTLRFMPRIQRWVMGLAYGDVSIQGIAIVTSLNLLRPWKNTIPFGIACVTTDSLDPYQINSFSDEIANLYLLDVTDVETIEQQWFE
jgi:hypothetical protein